MDSIAFDTYLRTAASRNGWEVCERDTDGDGYRLSSTAHEGLLHVLPEGERFCIIPAMAEVQVVTREELGKTLRELVKTDTSPKGTPPLRTEREQMILARTAQHRYRNGLACRSCCAQAMPSHGKTARMPRGWIPTTAFCSKHATMPCLTRDTSPSPMKASCLSPRNWTRQRGKNLDSCRACISTDFPLGTFRIYTGTKNTCFWRLNKRRGKDDSTQQRLCTIWGSFRA